MEVVNFSGNTPASLVDCLGYFHENCQFFGQHACISGCLLKILPESCLFLRATRLHLWLLVWATSMEVVKFIGQHACVSGELYGIVS